MRTISKNLWYGIFFVFTLVIAQIVLAQQGFVEPVTEPIAEFVPGEIVVVMKPGASFAEVRSAQKGLSQGTAQRPIKESLPIEQRIAAARQKLRNAENVLRTGQVSIETLSLLQQNLTGLERLRTKTQLRQKRSTSLPSSTDIFQRLWLIKLPEEQINAQIALLKRQPGVAFVGRNEIVREERSVNDPLMPPFKLPGYLSDFLYGLTKIEAPAAWDASAGRADVVVAVNETGFDINHPDLAGNVWANAAEIAGNGIDDDGNGYIDDRYGVRFNTALPNQYSVQIPADTHGTHVAGTIAAVADNGIAVAGVAFNSKVMAATGYTLIERINAIIYAVDNGADVINNSWSLNYFEPYIYDAIEYAHSRGVIVVASASNDNSHSYAKLPAAATKAITVAAHDYLDHRAGFSNFGPKVDVTAPGVTIGSTLPNGGYGAMSGTSMSSPHVAGLAALILSRNLDLHEVDPTNNPLLNVEQVRQIIRKSADDIVENPNGGSPLGEFDIYSGYGRINARKALELTASATDIIAVKVYSPEVNYESNNGELRFMGGWAMVYGSFDLKGVISGSHLDHFEIEEGAGIAPATWNFVVSGTSQVPGTAGQDLILGGINSNNLSNGLHTYRIRAYSSSGAVYEDRHLVFVARALISNYPEGWEWQGKALPLVFSPINLTGVAHSPNFLNYHLEYGVGESPSQWVQLGPTMTTQIHSPNSLFKNLSQSALPDGLITIRLVVEDALLGPSQHEIVVNNDGIQFPFLPGFPTSTNLLYTNFDTPVVADLNGDGIKEIVVSGMRGIAILDPQGTIMAKTPDPSNWEMRSIAAIGNLDADPELEIAIRGYNYIDGLEGIFVFNGDLTPLAQWPVWTRPYGSIPLSYLDFACNSVVLHDFDGDGREELVFTSIGDPLHSVHIMHSDGTDLAGWYGGLATTSGSPHTPAVGDINGDGTAEIVVSDKNGELSAFDRNGSLLWHLPGSANLYMQIGLADIDKNGSMEIIHNQGTTLKVFAGSGTLLRSISDVGSQVFRYALNDLNNDGTLDIITSSYGLSSGQYRYIIGANSLLDGASLPGWPYLQTESNVPGFPVVSDIDGDGSKEIIVGTGGSSTPALFTYRSNGTRIEPATDPRFPFRKSGALVTSPILADVNGNGTTELLYDPVNFPLMAYQLPGSLATDGSDWTSPYFDLKNTGNYRTTSLVTPKPDLTIERIELDGDKIPTVFFTNRGTASVLPDAILHIQMRAGATVRFSVDIALKDLPSQAYRLPGGTGSAKLNVMMSYAIRDIDAAIDTADLVTESDETNNQLTATLKALPDLVVSDIRVSADGFVEVTVQNHGNDIVPAYINTIDLNVRLAGLSQNSTINLKTIPDQNYGRIGGSTTVTINAWSVPSGTQTIIATADFNQQLVELSEDTNQKTLTVNWP